MQNLEAIKIASIKCLCQCLEFQFDTVIGDRIMILQRMHMLNNIFPQANILSWEFFLSRFDTLSLEAQLDLESTGDITCPTDLTSSDKESENFLRKLNRARFALARTDSIRSVSSSLSGKPPYRRAVSVPMHLLTKSQPPKGQRPRRLTHPDTSLDFGKDKSCIRQQSAPQFRLRRQGTKFNLASFANSMFPGGQLKEFTDEESNFAALLQRAMDLEGVDRETVYMLVSFLMKYMVKCEDKINEDKDASKAQNIVLRHLNVLLGYNQTEKSFSVPPHRLRSSAVFNSFLSGIPFVLDRNFKLGNTILPITLLLLQYGPSPQRYASDYQPPNYTLWYLEPHTRVSWLNALLVVLYKYQIDTSPVSAIVQILVRIVVNTIEAQHHRCKTSHEDGFPPPSPTVHKNWTKISASDLENIEETETPPQSPTSLESVKVHLSATTDGATVHYNKKPDTTTEERKTTTIQETPLRRPVRPKRAPRKLVHYSEEDAGTESNGEQTPTESEQKKMPQSISMEEKMAEQIKEFEIKGDHGKMAKGLTGAEVVRSTDSPTDPSKESTTGQTESSKDGMSEVDSVMDDSEKTQTSEADSERNQANDDSAGDAAHEEEKNPHSTKSPIKPNFRQRKARKTGLTTVELQKIFPELAADSSNGGKEEEVSSKTKMGRRSRRSEMLAKAQAAKKQVPHGRCGENTLMERCTECNAVLEQYDDDTIGLCIVVLSTFIHREPSLATPMLLEILLSVSRIASCSPYTWQTDCSIMVPGSTMSIARQFLRCCLHQLAPNGIFPMLFQSNLDDTQFLKTMAAALIDFSELPCHAPIHFLLEGLNNRKSLSSENIMQLLNNLATYMNCNLDSSTSSTMWTNIINEFDTFLRRLSDILPVPCDMTPILKIITSLLKVMGIINAKFILEPFAKLISIGIQHCSFKLAHVLDICSLCNRVFNKERDKLYLTRTVIFQLVQAMRFKTSLPDENFLLLVQFAVLDAGGTICSSNIVADIGTLYNTHAHMLMSTCAAECMRQHLNDCMEFVGDLHTINNVKTNMKGGNCSMNEDTLGGQVKSGVAQFIALEITRSNGRDNRAISRYLPWLYHPPSTTQQGPKEFTDCIGHIGLLSWLLIGSLTHTAMTEGVAPITCMPIPLDASTYVAEHVLVILTGFAEESKNSVLHMSSLFHAFFLCQLWTMYCESAAAQYSPNSDQHQNAMTTIMDFWGRVTPGILQLLSHSKVLAEMVNLHFLSLMEALQECNSSVLAKLFPMWTSILYAYHGQLPGHLHVRLQNCHNWKPPTPTSEENFINSNILLTWLKRIQFKLGQIEVQSSAATQFYTV
ncbi:hypothetical protein CHS0354_000200 [Potamilus streckersoni]|nr:hypothetical protein CHS0354_000200 [Potamilus streckersoni]